MSKIFVNSLGDKYFQINNLIDIRSGKEYGPPNSYNNQPDQYEIEFREQKEGIEKKISKFLKGNSKYLQVIPSHKIDYYTGMDRFIDFDETAISRLIDEDKLEEFNRLKEEAMKLKEYKAKNLIGIAHF